MLPPHLETRVAALSFVGVLLVTIAGSRIKTVKWTTVGLERLTVGPTQDGGLALGVTISF
ncbi:MAG TPA: hypothetical protein VGU74_08890 [Gemmatimonadales bacterium]|nr:hypothetical protein [Gemmatimonadales bacterium]